MPVLYFHNAGKFYKVPEANSRKIYYKYGNSDCSPDTSLSEFPQGFRMMTGNAKQREANDVGLYPPKSPFPDLHHLLET